MSRPCEGANILVFVVGTPDCPRKSGVPARSGRGFVEEVGGSSRKDRFILWLGGKTWFEIRIPFSSPTVPRPGGRQTNGPSVSLAPPRFKDWFLEERVPVSRPVGCPGPVFGWAPLCFLPQSPILEKEKLSSAQRVIPSGFWTDLCPRPGIALRPPLCWPFDLGGTGKKPDFVRFGNTRPPLCGPPPCGEQHGEIAAGSHPALGWQRWLCPG